MELSKQKGSEIFVENMAVSRKVGEIAGIAQKVAERKIDVPVRTSRNAVRLNQVATNFIEGVGGKGSEKWMGHSLNMAAQDLSAFPRSPPDPLSDPE